MEAGTHEYLKSPQVLNRLHDHGRCGWRAVVPCFFLMLGMASASLAEDVSRAGGDAEQTDELDRNLGLGRGNSASNEPIGGAFHALLVAFFALLATNALIVQPRQSRQSRQAVVSDPADDKFFDCALAADCRIIISGDKRMIAASGYKGVEVLRPRSFVETYL